MQTDGEIEMTKLIVAFRNSANAPKIVYFLLLYFFEMARTSGLLILLTFTQHLHISITHWRIPYNTRAEIPAAVFVDYFGLLGSGALYFRDLDPQKC